MKSNKGFSLLGNIIAIGIIASTALGLGMCLKNIAKYIVKTELKEEALVRSVSHFEETLASSIEPYTITEFDNSCGKVTTELFATNLISAKISLTYKYGEIKFTTLIPLPLGEGVSL